LGKKNSSEVQAVYFEEPEEFAEVKSFIHRLHASTRMNLVVKQQKIMDGLRDILAMKKLVYCVDGIQILVRNDGIRRSYLIT